VLRAAGETETTQENIQDWLQLDVSFLYFYSFLNKGSPVILFIFFISTVYIIKFSTLFAS
jgi:hypothetical protein